MTDLDDNPYLVEKQAFTMGYTAALMPSMPDSFEDFSNLELYEHVRDYLVQAASETDQAFADLEPHIAAGFEMGSDIAQDGIVATDCEVEYLSDAGRYIFRFYNPDQELTVSFPPYRIAALLEAIFEEGKWGAVPDLDAMENDNSFSTPEGLDEDE